MKKPTKTKKRATETKAFKFYQVISQNKKFNYIIVGINQFFRIDPAPTHRIPAVTKGVFCFVGFRV